MKRIPLFLLLVLTAGAEVASEKKTESRFRDITVPESVAAIAADKKLVVIDIRTAPEFEAGHLTSAANIDFKGQDFRAQLEKLDRTQPYLVYCRSGRRSTAAMKLFKELGFTNVLHMKDGYLGWNKKQVPKK